MCQRDLSVSYVHKQGKSVMVRLLNFFAKDSNLFDFSKFSGKEIFIIEFIQAFKAFPK